MGPKLIWLLLIIVLIAIFSSLFKIKEEFRARARTSSTIMRASSARSTSNVTGGNTTRSTSNVTGGNTTRSTPNVTRVNTTRSTPNVTTGNSVRGTSKPNKNRSKKVKTKTTLKLKVDGDGDGDRTSRMTPANSLNIINGNVVVPNDTTIEFGGGVNGKEINAGKIRYGGWDGGALNIVGAASDASNRTVRVWDKLRVGPLEIQADGCIGYGPGKKFTLCLQEDGNVVQYKDKKPVWATGVPS